MAAADEHTCEYTRSRARESGRDRVILPIGSPHLDTIESLRKRLKRSISPRSVPSTKEFRAIVRDVIDERARKVSFATDRIERLLNIQKLS